MLQSHDTFLEENSKWIRTRPTAMTNLIWSSEIFSQERKAKGDISHNTKSGKTIVTFKHNKAATCIHPTGHKFWVIMSNIMSFLLSHWRMASYSWMHLSWWREIPFLNLLFSKLKLIIGLQEYFDNMNKKQSINQCWFLQNNFQHPWFSVKKKTEVIPRHLEVKMEVNGARVMETELWNYTQMYTEKVCSHFFPW